RFGPFPSRRVPSRTLPNDDLAHDRRRLDKHLLLFRCRRTIERRPDRSQEFPSPVTGRMYPDDGPWLHPGVSQVDIDDAMFMTHPAIYSRRFERVTVLRRDLAAEDR